MSDPTTNRPRVVESFGIGHATKIVDTKNLQILKTSIPIDLHDEVSRRAERAGITYDQWFSLALAATLPAILSSAALDVIAHHWTAAQWPPDEALPSEVSPPGAA